MNAYCLSCEAVHDQARGIYPACHRELCWIVARHEPRSERGISLMERHRVRLRAAEVADGGTVDAGGGQGADQEDTTAQCESPWAVAIFG